MRGEVFGANHGTVVRLCYWCFLPLLKAWLWDVAGVLIELVKCCIQKTKKNKKKNLKLCIDFCDLLACFQWR